MTANLTSETGPDARTVTDKERIRFTRVEVPRLLGFFGFIVALRLAGFGIF